MMLNEGRLPLTAVENAAVEKLIGVNGEVSITFTRRDPGEQGPLLVHVADKTYEVDEQGNAVEQGGAS